MILTLAEGQKALGSACGFYDFPESGDGSSLGRVGKTCLTGTHCQASSVGTHDTRLPHPSLQFVRKSHKTERESHVSFPRQEHWLGRIICGAQDKWKRRAKCRTSKDFETAGERKFKDRVLNALPCRSHSTQRSTGRGRSFQENPCYTFI